MTTNTVIVDQPIRKLIKHIESIPDSEHQPPSSEEVMLIAGILIQQLILTNPLLDQTIQELVDEFHFG